MKYRVATTLCLLILTACTFPKGPTHDDIYNHYRQKGFSKAESLDKAQAYCLSNPCHWP